MAGNKILDDNEDDLNVEDVELDEESEGEAEETEELEEVEESEEVNSDDEEADEDAEEEADEGELSITLEGEEEEENSNAAPKWVKETRELYKSAKEENRKLKQELEKLRESAQVETVPKLSPKPTISDFDYDADEYEKALGDWFNSKAEYDKYEAEKQAKAQKEQERVNSLIESYSEKRKALKVSDFDEAENLVADMFDREKRLSIIKTLESPEKVVYLIGKRPDLAKKLSSITDHDQFVAEIVRLESKMKVGKKTPKVKPESKVRSSGGGSLSNSDDKLERLRAKAQKTGDYRELLAYKEKLRK